MNSFKSMTYCKKNLIFIFCILFVFLCFPFRFCWVNASQINSAAQLIENEYQREEILIADIICDETHGYNVDATGNQSSTMALQKAVDDCSDLGGGTVYLPAGNYKITSRIDVKPFVNIVGDYSNPDNDLVNYGTVIVAGVNSTEEDVGENYNLFRLEGSTALMGLTFFYPNQYMDVIMPYAYAIEIPGGITDDMHMLFTLKNITFINAYKGICASITKHSTVSSITHEQIQLENVKGTILREGVHLTNSSEVGTFKNVTFSSKYWASAGEEYNAPNEKNIIDFTSKNSVGMILGDLEWQEISNITINNYHTGIYFTKGDRNTTYSMSFIGSFYNLSITGAVYGIYVEQMYNNMGIQFAKSQIEGLNYSIMNSSPATDGHIQLSGVTLKGETCGPNIYSDNNYKNEICGIEDYQDTYPLPKMVLYNVLTYGADNSGKTNTAQSVQNALDDAHRNGGGIVYLPAGYYKFMDAITVYDNTLLRGCSSALSRDLLGKSGGTLILSYYGENNNTSDTDTALITLNGNNCGISGIRFIYPNLNLFSNLYTPSSLPKYNFTIRGKGEKNYATNLYIEGAYNGIDFSTNGNYSLIKKVMGAYYNIGYKISGKNCVIENCLQNAICITKVNDFSDWGAYSSRTEKLATNVYNITRYNTKVIILENAENAKINNVFSFASNTFITAKDSTFTGSNLGMDSQPTNSGAMFKLENTKASVFNTLRDACSTKSNYLTQDSSTFSVYNRITLLPGAGMNCESNLIEGESLGFGKTTSTSIEISKIWKDSIDYTYVQYSQENTNTNDSNTSNKKGNYLLVYILVGLFLIIGIFFIVFFIVKKRKN